MQTTIRLGNPFVFIVAVVVQVTRQTIEKEIDWGQIRKRTVEIYYFAELAALAFAIDDVDILVKPI